MVSIVIPGDRIPYKINDMIRLVVVRMDTIKKGLSFSFIVGTTYEPQNIAANNAKITPKVITFYIKNKVNISGCMSKGFVSVIAGSKSDESVVNKAIDVLKEFEVNHEVQYISAHRNPEELKEYVKNNEKKVDVFICIAGLSAALPGVVASLTKRPVIGVPVNIKLDGLDALLSMMQMPSGVPVATVGIDNGKNAAHLAIRILKLKYPDL